MELSPTEERRIRTDMRTVIRALYRVTDAFPQHEPLRILIREESLRLMGGVERFLATRSTYERQQTLVSLRVLFQYVCLAQEQNWMRSENFDLLLQSMRHWAQNLPGASVPATPRYEVQAVTSIGRPRRAAQNASKKEVPKVSRSLRTPATKDSSATGTLSSRQRGIVQHLEHTDSAQIGQLSALFPSISKRTIRRDLERLVRERIIRRAGKTNGTLYSLIRT